MLERLVRGLVFGGQARVKTVGNAVMSQGTDYEGLRCASRCQRSAAMSDHLRNFVSSSRHTLIAFPGNEFSGRIW
jgi:hypothetical protein